ncbi:3'-5' exonuclease [Desulfovibrio litoralis]|uniref:DNA polymerase-3 subunit epsilon n=1 Tax=Desulfovibrio litoralis DSM 11393 TaxID=1121455 RepID=A0A1M7SVW0_9BACT|nr:3'-5' exonuclease [Desulfovibrio litoralis]SHN62591.1 DNA polymerase-3 subunit epsilon [Desulfovibrio litoralis DSM 11393]
MDLKKNLSYIAIDFETADYKTDSACAIGMAKIQDGKIINTFYSLIRPPRKKIYFTNIHGLSWDMLKNSPVFSELWNNIYEYIQGTTYFIAHNAPFDRRVLHGCCQSSNIQIPTQEFICTLSIARSSLKLPSNSLDNVCKHLGIEFKHHHAEDDAIAAAKVFLSLQEKNTSL